MRTKAKPVKHFANCQCEHCRWIDRMGARQHGDVAQVANDWTDLEGSGRSRYCSRYSLRGELLEKPGETKFMRLNCHCWQCSYCAPRKASRYRHAIADWAEKLHLVRFVTLTLDPFKINGEPTAYLKHTFAKFRTYLYRLAKQKRGKGAQPPQYICVLELQKNGTPHLHLLIDRYIEWEWIQTAWSAVGGGTHVDIRRVDLHRVSHYLSKYLTKELLMSAPKRSRRVTCSRGITPLLERPTKTANWVVLWQSIFHLLHMNPDAEDLEHDEEGVLQSFIVRARGS